MVQLYCVTWYLLLALIWNDFAFIAWVALTVAPFLIEFE